MKSLYGVSQAGNHSFAINYCHYLENIGITESINDLCFLFRNESFTVIELQTNDTLIFANNAFAIYEKKTNQIAKIMTQLREQLDMTHFIKLINVKIKFSKNRSFYFNYKFYV